MASRTCPVSGSPSPACLKAEARLVADSTVSAFAGLALARLGR